MNFEKCSRITDNEFFEQFGISDNLAEVCPKYTPKEELQLDTRKFSAKEFGEYLKNKFHFLIQNEKDNLWYYNPNKGIWEPNGNEIVQKEVLKLLGDDFNVHKVNEVIKYIRFSSYCKTLKIGTPPHKIVMQNGVYDLKSDTFGDFNPELFAITSIPIIFNEEANCPNIQKFLSEIVGKKDVDKLIELAGYCLYKAYPISRFVVLVGEGSNGKSTYLELLKTFLGFHNVSALTLQQLSDNSGFEEAELYAKLANICGDIPSKPLKDTGTLKKLTGKDVIHANRKFKSYITFVNFAKPIFSANKLPSSRDETFAFHRRAVIIDFPNRFDEGVKTTDTNIIKKLTTPEELSGFFNLAVRALKKFLVQGKFSNEATTEEKMIDYMKRSDPIQYFCVKFVKEELGNYITKEEVYDSYLKLCHKLGQKPMTSNWFSKRFRTYVTYADDTRTYIDDKQVRVWKGITIDLELLDEILHDNQQDAKTQKTIFPNCGIKSEYHIESENQENASLASHESKHQTELNENKHKIMDVMENKTEKKEANDFFGYPNDGKFLLCSICKKPIPDLDDFTNKKGRPCHKSCKSKQYKLKVQPESILNQKTTNDLRM